MASDKKNGRFLSKSADQVAGAHHILYGQNSFEPVPIQKRGDLSSSSMLLAQTVPTLLRTLDPLNPEFITRMRQYQDRQFTKTTPMELAVITEIALE